MRNSFCRSPSSILATGIPVQRLTTSAISSSVTLCRSKRVSAVVTALPAASSCFSSSGIRPYCNSDKRVRSLARRAAFTSCRARSSASFNCWAPCTAAFSDFQTSSKSEYSLSRSSISCSRAPSLLSVASSVSFFSASLSILS